MGAYSKNQKQLQSYIITTFVYECLGTQWIHSVVAGEGVEGAFCTVFNMNIVVDLNLQGLPFLQGGECNSGKKSSQASVLLQILLILYWLMGAEILPFVVWECSLNLLIRQQSLFASVPREPSRLWLSLWCQRKYLKTKTSLFIDYIQSRCWWKYYGSLVGPRGFLKP